MKVRAIKICIERQGYVYKSKVTLQVEKDKKQHMCLLFPVNTYAKSRSIDT